MIDVSIVIVCMNNLKNLYPCLESIRRYTTVSYECMVVAFLFSKENLEKVWNDFFCATCGGLYGDADSSYFDILA